MSLSWTHQWFGRAVLAVALAGSSMGALAGCAPGECKDAKPLIAEVRTALGKFDTQSALPGAEKLHAALASATTPELKLLDDRTRRLVETLKRAEKVPTSEGELAERDRTADELGRAVEDWQRQAANVDTQICK